MSKLIIFQLINFILSIRFEKKDLSQVKDLIIRDYCLSLISTNKKFFHFFYCSKATLNSFKLSIRGDNVSKIFIH